MGGVMPREKQRRMMVARETGVIQVGGTPYSIHAGVTRVSEDNPLVAAAPHLWELARSHYPELEQMTAAPGERRGE